MCIATIALVTAIPTKSQSNKHPPPDHPLPSPTLTLSHSPMYISNHRKIIHHLHPTYSNVHSKNGCTTQAFHFHRHRIIETTISRTSMCTGLRSVRILSRIMPLPNRPVAVRFKLRMTYVLRWSNQALIHRTFSLLILLVRYTSTRQSAN